MKKSLQDFLKKSFIQPFHVFSATMPADIHIILNIWSGNTLLAPKMENLVFRHLQLKKASGGFSRSQSCMWASSGSLWLTRSFSPQDSSQGSSQNVPRSWWLTSPRATTRSFCPWHRSNVSALCLEFAWALRWTWGQSEPDSIYKELLCLWHLPPSLFFILVSFFRISQSSQALKFLRLY